MATKKTVKRYRSIGIKIRKTSRRYCGRILLTARVM